MISDESRIYWLGFDCSVYKLKMDGWEFYSKPALKEVQDCTGKKRLRLVGDYIYLQHTKHCMLGRFLVGKDQSEHTLFSLDFLINKKQLHRKMLSVYETTIDDDSVADVYTALLSIQKKYKKPDVDPLPMAEIISLMRA